MSDYPSQAEVKRDILEAGRRLYARGLVASNDGNISGRISPSEVWATPTGVSKGYMTEDMLVKLDLDGRVLSGDREPSSEIKMHLAVYRENPAILGVVHAHPPVATAFAAAGAALDLALLQEAVILLGVIPVAPFELPGSDALAQGAAALCRDYNGALLEHHGAVAWDGGVVPALYRMESIEYNATVAMYSKIMGITRPMTDEQIDALLPFRAAWGVTGGGRPRSANNGGAPLK